MEIAANRLVEVYLLAPEIFLEALEGDVVLGMACSLKLQLHSGAGGKNCHCVILLYVVPDIYSLAGNGAVNGGKIPCFIWVVKLHIFYDSGAVLGYHVLCVALLDSTDICPCADICAVCAVIDAVSAVLLEPLENSLPCARECGLDGRVGDYHYLSVLQVLKEPFCIVVIISCSGLARLDALAAGNALVIIYFHDGPAVLGNFYDVCLGRRTDSYTSAAAHASVVNYFDEIVHLSTLLMTRQLCEQKSRR